MKQFLFSITLLMVAFIAKAQNTNCIFDCSKRSISGTQQANFFQNPTMNKYDVKYLKLDVRAQAGSRAIVGICSYNIQATATVDTVVMEFKSTMTLDSVYVDGVKKTFTHASDHVNIPMVPNVTTGQKLDVVYYYRGTVSSGAFYTGSFSSAGLTYTASLSESYQAREWFPAKQILSDKIDSLDVWVTTNTANKAGSNGVLRETVNLGGGLVQYKWHSNYPIDYYLPSIAVGNYAEYNFYAKPAAIAPDSILVQNYIAPSPSYLSSIKFELDKTAPFIEKFSELFGIYPFYKEKYGHSLAGIGGGMEHQTMTTQDGFDAGLISHELAHQWFGDNVTCATWNDIWLNEGFATYGAHLITETLPGYIYTASTQNMIDIHTGVMAQPGGSVYVPLASTYDENRIFSYRLSYLKGAAIIHTLRFEMQDDTKFFNTLKQYQTTYKGSTANAAQFKAIAETVSGRNLTNFFNDWYYGEGFPTISAAILQKWDTLRLTINQTTSSTTPFFHGYLAVKVTSAQGDTTVIVDMQTNGQTFTFPYRHIPTALAIDPDNFIVNAEGSKSITIDSTPMGIPTGPGNPITPGVVAFNIYPNPARTSITVTYPLNHYTTLLMYDAMGRLVHKQNISGTITTLSAPATNGVYVVKLAGKSEEVRKKVLVQR